MGLPCVQLTATPGYATDGTGALPTIPVTIHYEYRRATTGETVLYKVRYTDAGGVIYLPPAGWTVKSGDSKTSAFKTLLTAGINLASGTLTPTYDPIGNGASKNLNTISKLKAFSVTVIDGGVPNSGDAVSVTFAASATKVYLLPGQTNSWSVASNGAEWNEILGNAVTIACVGNSAATVTWDYEA
jgi:hypothetical protein